MSVRRTELVQRRTPCTYFNKFLAKPIVRSRVPELAETIMATLPNVELANPTAEAVAALIRKRCQKVLGSFQS